MVSYHSYLKGVLLTYMLMLVIMSPLTIVRLTGLFNAAVLVRIILPLVFLSFLVFIWEKCKSRISLDVFSYFLLIVCFTGSLFGALRSNDPYLIIADTGAILIASVIYIVSQQPNIYPLKLKKILEIFAYAMFASESLTVLLGYALKFMGVTFYMSLSSVLALFPIAWFLSTRRYRLVLAMFLVVMLGGKVGVMLSALVIILVHLLLLKRLSLKYLLVGGFLFFIAINATLFSIKDVEFSETGPFGATLSKIQYQNPYSLTVEDILLEGEDQNVEEYGGGRVAEVIFSMSKLLSLGNQPLLTGGGHGFSYDYIVGGVIFNDVHNVHLSPVSLLVKYGLIVTLLYYVCTILLFNKYYRYLITYSNEPLVFALFYFCVGNFVFSFTAYSIFVVGLYWFFLGFLTNLTADGRQLVLKIAQRKVKVKSSE